MMSAARPWSASAEGVAERHRRFAGLVPHDERHDRHFRARARQETAAASRANARGRGRVGSCHHDRTRAQQLAAQLRVDTQRPKRRLEAARRPHRHAVKRDEVRRTDEHDRHRTTARAAAGTREPPPGPNTSARRAGRPARTVGPSGIARFGRTTRGQGSSELQREDDARRRGTRSRQPRHCGPTCGECSASGIQDCSADSSPQATEETVPARRADRGVTDGRDPRRWPRPCRRRGPAAARR